VEQVFIGLISGLVLMFLFVIGVMMSRVFVQVSDLLNSTRDIRMDIFRLHTVANTILDTMEDYADGISMPEDHTVKMYKSLDGRHAAESIEGLITKMANDPTYDKGEIENLKKMFEENIDEDEYDEDDFLK
jgi:hypothetical protein